MSFLTPGIREIRHSIIDIDDSYNNPWDIIAELCQNAVDAIKEGKPEEGLIRLAVDCNRQEITIYDNGIGILPENLPEILKPFSGNKMGSDESIGEKGVGLTFVLFSCNEFRIKSGTEKGVCVGEVMDACNWKRRKDDVELELKYDHLDEDFKGTEIHLKGVENCPIFDLTFQQFKFILRSKTAIGNTYPLWGDESDIRVEVKYIDRNANEGEDTIINKYWMLYEGIPENSIIDLDDFINFAKSADVTDLAKRKKLQDKIICVKGEFVYSNVRTINYIACFVPKRAIWDELSLFYQLCTQDNLEDDEWMDIYHYTLFRSGIYTSVKGMPTGISIEHPITGYAGYWANIFILFEDRHLKFDIGRKSIHGMQARLYKGYAREIFNLFLKYVVKYVSGDVQMPPEWNRDETFTEIASMLDLNISGIKLAKTPKDQEAAVTALFFECIGNGKITEIKPLTAGYRSKYDLYAEWGNKKIVIEFKSKLQNILRDFQDEQKLFNEIDCIVCWDVSDDDRQKLKARGIDVEEINPSMFSGPSRALPHSTHQLLLSGFVPPIYIIDLKKMLTST